MLKVRLLISYRRLGHKIIVPEEMDIKYSTVLPKPSKK